MLKVTLLPAHHGDSILIEYGDTAEPHRVLIDGGTESSTDAIVERLGRIGSTVALELLVVTHVDEDHIGGMLKLLAADTKLVAPKDVWFNAYKHLFRDKLGAAMGEALSTAIEDAAFNWNRAFGGMSVVVPDKGTLPEVPLADGAKITLVSPTWSKLEKLRPRWEAECKKAGLLPGAGAKAADVLGKHPPPTKIDVDQLLKVAFHEDPSAANGSSIAFLFEHESKRILLGADAHPRVVLTSLLRLSRAPVSVDAFKICHHGSRNNTTAALLGQLDCKRFLVSTNGETFGHPDPEALARVVSRPGEKILCFNYDTDYSKPWNKQGPQQKYAYAVELPDDDGELVVEL
jgi:beta-lactamase superfamily II metal-dependent hydrolase